MKVAGGTERAVFRDAATFLGSFPPRQALGGGARFTTESRRVRSWCGPPGAPASPSAAQGPPNKAL